MEWLTIVPPWVAILLAAPLLVVVPRTFGYTLAGVAVFSLIPVSLLAPAGTHVQVPFLGFDATFFLVDEFTRLLGFGFGVLGTAAVWYAFETDLSRRSGAVAMTYVATTMAVVFAGDWLTVVFFWELMAITSTVLVWVYGGAAVRAGYRYAIAHGIGGSLVLFAVIWHYAEVGTFAFEAPHGFAPGGAAVLGILGIGVNLGFIGLHTWLPDTYPRPHVASSVFLSVFTTKTSAYVLYRALPTDWVAVGDVDVGMLIAYMGGLMAVYGVVFALLQHDMRALLSYHIQAQVGYMVAGIGMFAALAESIAIAGAMGHLFNNVMYKALLFMAVGVIIARTGEHDLYDLGGLWREMPLTAIAFAIGALSITAVPGTNGFISKGMVLDAADPGYYGAPEFQALWWLLMIGALGTFLSFIKLGYYAFLHGPSDRTVQDATIGQTVAMFAIGAVCLVFGIWWQGFAGMLPGGPELLDAGELHPYSVGHLSITTALIVASVLSFVAIKRPLSGIGHVRDVDRWTAPLVFHTGKYAMVGLTGFYAIVDRAVVRIVNVGYWIANHPVEAAGRAGIVNRPASARRRSADGGYVNTVPIRASIGLTVLIITVLLTVILALLLW